MKHRVVVDMHLDEVVQNAMHDFVTDDDVTVRALPARFRFEVFVETTPRGTGPAEERHVQAAALTEALEGHEGVFVVAVDP